MADQRRTVSEIIAEMREELRNENDPDADLFAPYMSNPRKPAGKKAVKSKRVAKKKAVKKKPARGKAKRPAGKPAKKKAVGKKPAKGGRRR